MIIYKEITKTVREKDHYVCDNCDKKYKTRLIKISFYLDNYYPDDDFLLEKHACCVECMKIQIQKTIKSKIVEDLEIAIAPKMINDLLS